MQCKSKQRKWSIWRRVILLTVFLMSFFYRENICANNAKQQTDDTGGTEKQGETDTDDLSNIYGNIFEELHIGELEQELKSEGIDTPLPIQELVTKQIEGDTKSVFHSLVDAVGSVFVGELVKNKNLMLELVGIVLIGSIFVNLSNSFAGGFISENGFYITYMLMTSLLLSSFTMALSITMAALDKVIVAIRLLVPAFMLILQFLGHTTTAGGTYNIVLIGIWLIQAVIIRFILPLIEFYVMLSLVNNLQKEDSFSKLAELVHSVIKWLLRTIVVLVVGLNVIKGLLEPQMDMLGKTAVKRALSSMPGGVVSVLAGTYLACGMVIKNSIGIAGILILSFICLIPLVQLFLIMFTVRITTALIQPIGDRRFVDSTTALAKGIAMLMQALASSLVLFVITLAIMAGVTNG